MNDAPIITRGGFLRGILAAGVAPAIIPVAEAHTVAGLRRGLALRQSMLSSSNGEEEMYKEMYLATIQGSAYEGTFEHLIDNVSTYVNRPYAFQGSKIDKITFEKLTICAGSFFRGCSSVSEINLPICNSFSGYTFNGCSNLSVLRVPVAENLGANSISGLANLTDVYLTGKTLSQLSGFPWGCTNASTVFHCADGNYDYQRNPV